MWARLTRFIIRYRLAFLVVILGLTAYMGFQAKKVELSYDFPQVIPVTDPDFQFYKDFKKQFGEDGDLMIVGFQNKDVFRMEIFNHWYKLSEQISHVPGVKTVASVSKLYALSKDTATHKFVLRPFPGHLLTSEKEADSLKAAFLQLPFYNNLLYNDSTHATLMAIKIDPRTLLSKRRVDLIDSLVEMADGFATQEGVDLHYSGLPYIRTTFAQKIQQELNLFLILSVIVTSIILLIFFRSFYNVIFPLAIISIIIVWTLGFIVLLGYKLTLLTGLIPPLIVIIAVPNFIYFLNRYHSEYKKYHNKYGAIIMMVRNIARIVFLNNTTTGIGFGVLFFIKSPVLKEFGLVAFIMIVATYLITLVLMPIIFSYMPEPTAKQTKYLQNKYMSGFITGVTNIAERHRNWLYAISILITLTAGIGASKLHAIGYIMDDIPSKDKLYKDLGFFEQNFQGLMPFEITIDTKHPQGLQNLRVLNKIDQLQDTLKAMPEFGNVTSIVNVVKYGRQAFYNGNPARYGMPSTSELAFMRRYLQGVQLNKSSGLNLAIVDSSFSTARISAKIKDVGSVKLAKIVRRLEGDIDSIFAGDDVSHRFTGYSLIFLKGNSYLIENLVSTLILAIALIIIVIAILFPSFRLVVITLVPNLLALLITAGIMGWFNIPLKPSTVLVFSIAFGIAADASFHLLVNYRQDLIQHNWDIPKTVDISLRQTGSSIVYTSLVLFFGFGIFCFSTFGSTISLGALTSITVLCAMFTNIILLPALLISFDRKSRKTKTQ